MGVRFSSCDNKSTQALLEKAKVTFEKHWRYERPCSGSIDDYDRCNTLGTGSFGKVDLVRNKETNEYYALKTLNKVMVVKLKQFSHVMNEKKILLASDHPFIVKLIKRFKDDSNLYFVLEFVPGGEMFSFVERKTRLSEAETKFYVAQIVLAVEYLHFMNIIYRDLKPENILIGKKGYIKIIDFGLSKRVLGKTYTICGTPQYLAPETILNRGYNCSVDWWALGVLIYELLAGSPPFTGKNDFQIYEKIITSRYKFRSHFSKKSRHLISNLMQFDTSRRYGNLQNGTLDIKSHKWFSGHINWERIYLQEMEPPFIPILKCASDDSHFESYPDETVRVSINSDEPMMDFESF